MHTLGHDLSLSFAHFSLRTFLRATISITLVTNTTHPAMIENKANITSKLRTKNKQIFL